MEKIRKLVLYVVTDKIAGVNCSLDEALKEENLCVLDYDYEELTPDELEEFELE